MNIHLNKCVYINQSLSTLAPLGLSKFFVMGADLCISRCLATSLVSTH